ncbi:hypothetical protein AKO1_014806 [Acrasis kona]|uniref:DUF4209 domain-containing protein n=1 Tax=Acrasis kona TaxID=1008807 RepID=A0AAW2Z1I3_9EUKA
MDKLQDYINKSNDNTVPFDVVKEWYVSRAIKECSTQSELYEQLKSQFFTLRQSKQTSLSDKVVSIMKFQNQELLDFNTITQTNSDGSITLNWEELTISKLLNGNLDLLLSDNEDEMFIQCARSIQSIALTVHNKLFQDIFNNEPSNFINMYQSSMAILSQPYLFSLFVDEHCNRSSMLAFTMAVAYFEHGLQDVLLASYMSKNKRTAVMYFNENIPKLSEFLMNNDLSEIVGADKLFLLRAMFGPLNSLNLRNVTLHGFVTESEFHPCYTSLLLLLMVSLSRDISSLLSKPSDYLFYLDVSHPLKGPHPFEMFHYKMNHDIVTPELTRVDKSQISHLFERSAFIVPQFIDSHWKPALEYYCNEQYFHFLAIVFPALEHCIRRIFVCVNDCAHRFLTAEKNSLYTTLDILLSSLPCSYLPDGNNKIFEVFDVRHINMIYDLLLWKDSGRPRDCLSHGSLLPDQFSKQIADRVLILVLVLCNDNDVFREEHDSPISIVRRCCDFLYNEYEPLFHPKNMLEREIDTARLAMISYNEYVDKELSQLTERLSTCSQSSFSVEEQLLVDGIFVLTDPWVKLLSERFDLPDVVDVKFYPVGMTEKEFKKTNRLRQSSRLITDSMNKVVTICKDMNQALITGKSQGRKRDTVRTMIDHIPVYSRILKLFFLLIVVDYYKPACPDHDNSLSNVIEKCMSAIEGAIRAGKWKRAIELCFSIFMLDPDVNAIKTLNSKEIKRFYVDYTTIINTFHQ